MNRHPPSNYGDEPPAYLDHETASFLSDHESPTNASRGATMRLLPTSGDGADEYISPRAASPSAYDPDFDHTPYVLTAFLSIHP
jgi:chitin synthase